MYVYTKNEQQKFYVFVKRGKILSINFTQANEFSFDSYHVENILFMITEGEGGI